MINVKEIVESKINELWQEYKDESFCEIPPLSVSEVPSNGIIFVGINPSLSKKDRAELINSNKKNIDFYSLNNIENEEQPHTYFKKFIDISRKTNLKWGHFDLLYIRETQQKKIKDLLKTEKGCDFIFRQVLITKELVEKLLENKDLIFVVNNSFARDLLGTYDDPNNTWWMGLKFRWNDDLGTYTYKNIPFFFTSMLTGQRALDLGSYKRLIWHINFVKNKKEDR